MLSVLLLTLPLAGPPVEADPVIPAAPSQVTVGPRADMAVVTWLNPGASSWVVEISNSYPLVAPRQVATTTTIAVVTGLQPATTYYLRVRPRSADGEFGNPSATTTFTTVGAQYPAAAPAVTVTATSTTSLALEWEKVSLAASYQVSRSASPTMQDAEVTTVENPDAVLAKLTRGTTYYTSVRALGADGEPVSDWSPVAQTATPDQVPLRVASYNVLCENCSKGKASWASRRGALVETIKGQDPDVIGLQEASQGRIPGGGTQYQDIVRRLGDPYRITDDRKGASLAVRIVYNSDRVELVAKGSTFLPKGRSKRAATWAIFEQKLTGERFFFLDTHLEPTNDKKGSNKYYNVRRRQANAVVDIIEKNNPDKLPVIAVGDYNSTKWDTPTNAPYDIMENAGYLDPLGNGYRTRGAAPGAFVENRIHTSYASYNMYRRKARNFPSHVNGSNPDYIFVSTMRVSEYETVVDIDSSGRFEGVIPSDHNMIRATVWLP
ncbi:MAG: endonuclease/exonuclease/phosphatase family protein [Propionicimonas sp.]|nr:endonuclease/exonuclease/phosphatase family protein [Propionicimonas sp.]